jgi:hypothetical protein
MSADVFRYLAWGGAVVLGGAMAVVDRNVFRLWFFAFLLAAGIIGGLVVTTVSPFSFGSTSYYMHGIILSGGSALALSGYVLVRAVSGIWRSLRRHCVQPDSSGASGSTK